MLSDALVDSDALVLSDADVDSLALIDSLADSLKTELSEIELLILFDSIIEPSSDNDSLVLSFLFSSSVKSFLFLEYSSTPFS